MKYHKRVFQADFLGSRKSSHIQVLLGRIKGTDGGKILMDEIPLGDTRFVFRISK